MTIKRGTVLNDRYELLEVVGRGGVADVYRAMDQVLHREVAVKVLRAATPEPEEKQRFLREARILARLDHPGLTMVLDAGVAEERPFLSMHLVDGKTLADDLPRRGLPPDRVAEVGAELAETLAYAHHAGVVHRDVKPSNVLIDRSGRARLTDFGIARLLDDATRHTATGMTVGTAAYLSPEQLKGERASSATDVYSLGLVLLEALTGHQVYSGSVAENGPGRLTTPPVVPAELPEGWHVLLEDMTALDARSRPSAKQVARRLRDLGAATPVAPVSASPSAGPDATRVLHPDHSRGHRRRRHDVTRRDPVPSAARLAPGAVRPARPGCPGPGRDRRPDRADGRAGAHRAGRGPCLGPR